MKSLKFRNCCLAMTALGLSSIPTTPVFSQDSGVKISLTLTPSAPETPKTTTTEEKKPESTPEKGNEKKKSPFALSSFEKPASKAKSDDDKKNTQKSEDSELEISKTPSSVKADDEADDELDGTKMVDSKSIKKEKATDDKPTNRNQVSDDGKSNKSTDDNLNKSKESGNSNTSKSPGKSVPKSGSSTSGPTKTTDNKAVPGRKTGPQHSKGIKPLKLEGLPSSPDDNENAECPGGVEADNGLLKLPEDIPLEQEAHPFDAPAAEYSAKPDRPTPTARNARTFTSDQLKMRNDINRCLQYFLQNPETIARRSPWAVMHAILPYGVETELVGGNRRVNAIGWMCYNGMCKTQRIFQPTQGGFRTNLGPGVQGHEGQFLAILAQSKVAPNYPLKVGNRSYTVNDLVRYEMATCKDNSELTFKLIGLSYYLDQNQQWKDKDGGTWNLEKMVGQELDQPIVGAACGGTHRLMGLTFSLLQHKQAGLPVDGHWQRSEQYLNDFVQYAFTLQNPDGSFSTEWFESRGSDPNVEKKVQTTGHILEWLIYTLPDDQLDSPQVVKAVRFLLGTIGANPSRDWPIGPRGHSLRALALYNQRVFGAPAGNMKKHLASLRQENTHR